MFKKEITELKTEVTDYSHLTEEQRAWIINFADEVRITRIKNTKIFNESMIKIKQLKTTNEN